MRSFLAIIILALLFSCDIIQDINEIKGPCNIILANGSTVVTNGNIELLKSTGTITYRDDKGKIWSLFKEDYLSYSCN